MCQFQSKLYKLYRKSLFHLVGVVVQDPSKPLLMVSSSPTLAKAVFQPKPCCSIGALSGLDQHIYWQELHRVLLPKWYVHLQ